jgi:hypothetical protein
MPTTAPGFLLVAGTVMIVMGLIGSGIEVKELKLPSLSRFSRISIAVLGLIFLATSAILYWGEIPGQPTVPGQSAAKWGPDTFKLELPKSKESGLKPVPAK